ncbi:hypothetical protein [Shewanella maritima]|uniref:hypothetical protein n=1 Tax=Shewanella maritima TaxID=2520507 RepID=UPI003734C765
MKSVNVMAHTALFHKFNQQMLAMAVSSMLLIAPLTSHAATVDIEKAEQTASQSYSVAMQIQQDSNDITQAKVSVDGDEHEFNFTQDELKDNQALQETLAVLPEKVQQSVIAALTSLDGKHKMAIIKKQKLSAEDQQKLAELHEKLASKQADIEKKVRVFAIKSEDMADKQLEMETLAKEMAKLGEDYQVMFDAESAEVDVEIHQLADGLEAIVEQIVEIETQGLEVDTQLLGEGEHKVMIIHHDGDNASEQIERLIEHHDLSDEQKQKLRKLLETD